MVPQFPCTLLRKNHRSTFPRRVLYLDIETKADKKVNRDEHYLKIAWACFVRYREPDQKDQETWEKFDGTYPLWKWVEGRVHDDECLYIYGHNIFFDLQGSDFFHFFTRWGWTLDFIHDKMSTYLLFIRNGKRAIKIVSTTNYFPEPLEQIGEMLGMPKGKVDFELATDPQLSEYCRRDVEITKLAMERYREFVRSNDMGNFAVTRVSQAMTCYRHRYMSHKIYIHGNDEIKKLEKSAYIGGRTEAFHLGKLDDGPFVTLDINSMYPYVMRNNYFPVKLIDYRENPDIGFIRERIPEYGFVAEVDIETDRPLYAVHREHKIIFPVGRFRAFLNTPGLTKAITDGHLKRVHRLAVYDTKIIFKDYVDAIHKLRVGYKEEGNKIYTQITKYLLNGLYGKFGQYITKNDEHEDMTYSGYARTITKCADTGEQFIEYKLFNTVVQEIQRVPGKNSFTAISAHVTEYARFLLWKIVEPLWPNEILYCDTDSLKIRKSDLDKVEWPIDSNRLGSLKIEDESCNLEIRGAKNYVTEHKRVLKGIPRKAVEIEPYVYEFPSFQSQKWHMVNRIDRCFVVKPMRRIARPFYDKGNVLPDGRIVPIRLSEF